MFNSDNWREKHLRVHAETHINTYERAYSGENFESESSKIFTKRENVEHEKYQESPSDVVYINRL